MNTPNDISKHKQRVLDTIFKKYNDNITYKTLVAKYFKEFRDYLQEADSEFNPSVEDFERFINCNLIDNYNLDDYDYEVIKNTLNVNDLLIYLNKNPDFNFYDINDDFDLKIEIDNAFYWYSLDRAIDVMYNRYSDSSFHNIEKS